MDINCIHVCMRDIKETVDGLNLVVGYALVFCKPGEGRGIALEISGALTKVLPQLCGGF